MPLTKRLSRAAPCSVCVTSGWNWLDLLLNNAGIAVSKDFLDLSDDDFDRTVNVNLKSAYVASQAAARLMLASGTRGTITCMSSVNAVLNISNLLTYNITKGGLNQLTRNLAIRLAPHGIRVNAIGPGTILTDLVRNTIYTSDAAKAAVMSRTPMGRADGGRLPPQLHRVSAVPTPTRSPWHGASHGSAPPKSPSFVKITRFRRGGSSYMCTPYDAIMHQI